MFGSLRWKITAWFVGAAALVVLLVFVAVYLLESRALSHQTDSSIRAVGDSVRAATAAKLRVGDYAEPTRAAEEAIDTVVTHEWLGANDVFLVLLNPAGDVVANPDQVDATELSGVAFGGEALRAATEEWEVVTISDTRLRVRTMPIFDGNRDVIAFLLVGSSIVDQDAALRSLAVVMGVGGLISLVFLGLAGYLVAGRAIRPVQDGYQRQRQFVADASHELRTPLSVIRTNSEVLARRYDGDEAIEDIEAEARYMSRLVEDLLLLADSDSHRLRVEMAPVDLAAEVRTAARAATILARDAGVHFRAELTGEMPVEVDPERCREAILILLDNALKYTPRGGEVVLSGLTRDGHAVVEVRDSGVGMRSEDVERAADRFFAVSNSRTRSGRSRGLGLSIAFALTAAMNGTLVIDSEVGTGTTARLKLPLRPASAPSGSGASLPRGLRWLRSFAPGRHTGAKT